MLEVLLLITFAIGFVSGCVCGRWISAFGCFARPDRTGNNHVVSRVS